MRWLFIFLVFLNLFFYFWQRQQTTELSPPHHHIAVINENIPTLKLLTEQPIETVVTNAESNASQEKTTPSATLTAPTTCLYLGGVTNKDQLAVLADYLTKIDTTINPVETMLKKSLILHLYLTVNDKQQLELLTKLHGAQINALIINRGPLKNQLSLGSFVSQADTLSLQAELQKLQLTPQTENLTETAMSYWLKIPPAKQTLFTIELLLKLTQDLPTMQQELMPCTLTSD